MPLEASKGHTQWNPLHWDPYITQLDLTHALDQAKLALLLPSQPHPPHDPISKKDMGFLTTQKNTQKIAQCQNLHASAKPTPQIERTRKEQ